MAHRIVRLASALALGLYVTVLSPFITRAAADTTLPSQPRARYTPLSLAALSPTAAHLVARYGNAVSLAVAVPGQGIVYTANADTRLPLASVAKLLIMFTLLDQTTVSPRALNSDERELLDAMIAESDNDAADELWDEIGGNAGVRAFLDRAQISGFTLSPDDDWGDTAASGQTVAVLLARLMTGNLLDAPHRAVALDLMGHVTSDQRWGITVFADGIASNWSTIAVKNGWYPDDDGWQVSSAGVIVPKSGGQAYTIAVLTGGQPDLASGIAIIEAITRAVATALPLSPLPGFSGGTTR